MRLNAGEYVCFFAVGCMWSTHMASLVWTRWKKVAWLLLGCIHGKWGMNGAQFGI